MAVSQIINVIVNSRGAVTVRRELDKIGDSARSTTTYLNGLRAVLAAALTFSGAGAITEVVDNFLVMQNRLRQVADESNTVADSWERLIQIANGSYTSINNTVDLYFRVAQAYKAWGESAESAYKFTELFQKAATLSGSSIQTTSQAVYQFSQALNKGKLDGDEFRSVLEGLPYVATIIQKQLGVTRKELYELSKNGQISVDRIKEAFESAADTINRDWAKITPTIGMAIIVLKNNWTDFVGDIQTSTGVFSGIAQIILLIANNFDVLAVALAPVVVSLGFLAGRLGLGLVVMGLRDLGNALKAVTPLVWLFNAAMAGNPFVLAAVAIAAVVAAIIYFRNEIGLTNEVLSSLWEKAKAVFPYILATLFPIQAAINYIVTSFWSWSQVWDAIKSAAVSTGKFIANAFQAAVAGVKSFVDYAKKSLAPVFSDLVALFKSFYGLLVEIVGVFVDLLTPAIEAVKPVWDRVWQVLKPNLELLVKILKDAYDGWVIITSYIKVNFWPVIKEAFEGWIAIIRTVVSWVQKIIDALKQAISLMRQLGGGGGIATGGKGANYGAQFYAGEFANGGSFKVGGTGAGRDTTPVAFRANRGERVTVETKKQQRENDSQQAAAPSVNVPIQLINVLDPSMVPAANETSAGQRSILNVIKANRDEINYVLGVS